MRLSADEHCQLLLAVYPSFVAALPVSCWPPYTLDRENSSYWHTLSLNNYITELRDEVKRMGMNFNEEDAERELGIEMLKDARYALEDILYLFEDLIHDDIMVMASDNPKNHQLMQAFPKLATLRHEMSNEDAGAIRNMISYGTEARLYRRAISKAKWFNGCMKKIYSGAGGVESRQSYRNTQCDTREGPAALAQAQRLSKASSWLFSLLERKVCREVEVRHEGHLRLSEFHQPKLDMILSICGFTDQWQQAHFHLADKETQQSTIDSICPMLKQSLRLRNPTRLVFNETGIYKAKIERHDRFKILPTPSKETLGEILRDEESRRQSFPNHRILKHNKKRGLGVKIATALLYLFGSPILQANILDANSIYILQEDLPGKDTAPEAYVYFCLDSKVAERADSNVEDDNGDPSLLALTALLLELELEKEIVPCELDVGLSGQPSMYVAVTRHHDELEGNIDASFYEIIEDCLQLYADSTDMEETDYNTNVQTELLNKVVGPLTKRYATFLNKRQTIIDQTLGNEPERSTAPKPATWQTGFLGSWMKTIEEVTETPSQLDGCAVIPSFSSLDISEPHFLAGKISSSWMWLQRLDRVNDIMDRICQRYPTEKRVRIAILDTGCNMDATCMVNLADSEARLKGHWYDWAGNSTLPIDEDAQQHGTSVVALLLRIARQAEVFVGRIAKDKSSLNGSISNIGNAISHAATKWDVDIVTMSFGFPRQIPALEKVINSVIGKRKDAGRDILFFAAANNDGLNSGEMFPASNSNVISVRGTDHTGAFVREYNPNPWPLETAQALFGTLGKDVPYDCANKQSQTSGCSVATQVLAGTVAIIIQYASARDMGLQDRVKTRDGIRQVMSYMAEPVPGNKRCKYIAPWKFFERGDKERDALIINALAELQRSH